MDLMKIEDPLSPPGDQPDLNKLRTKQPLCVLGRKPVLCVSAARSVPRGAGVAGRGVHRHPCLGRTRLLCHLGPAESLHTCTSFIGAAGWLSMSWSLGWSAVSCRWGPAGRGGRAADWLG